MEWREVPGFLGYKVSEFGQLNRDGEAQVAERDRYGHRWFHLSKRKSGGSLRTIKRLAANLVASAYLGVSDELREDAGLSVRHRDGNVENDHYSNLIVVKWTPGLSRFEAGIMGLSQQLQRSLRVEYLNTLKKLPEKSVLIPVSPVHSPLIPSMGTVFRKPRRLVDPSRIIRGFIKSRDNEHST